MEIKIVCDCGTKFKFDVEPVHGRMPAGIACPACGADTTGQANAIIALSSTIAPPPPEAVTPPPARPGGLRINRPAEPMYAQVAGTPPPYSEPEEAAEQAAPRGTRYVPSASGAGTGESKGQFMKAVTAIVVVILVALGAWRFGYKWFKRLNVVAQVASAIGEAAANKGDSSEGPRNLWYDDCAMLFIKHTNHLEVAQACKTFWKEKLHKNLNLIDSDEPSETPGEYELIASHNGYVRILGTHEWPVSQLEGLAQYLSEKFGSLVFEWASESFADTYHFGVYDQGTRKFHAQMDVKTKQGDFDEIVTTEGNDFAIANGFKPGPDGFKNFHVLEADKITQRLGMKLWDEEVGIELKAMLLKESGPAAANR